MDDASSLQTSEGEYEEQFVGTLREKQCASAMEPTNKNARMVGSGRRSTPSKIEPLPMLGRNKSLQDSKNDDLATVKQLMTDYEGRLFKPSFQTDAKRKTEVVCDDEESHHGENDII